MIRVLIVDEVLLMCHVVAALLRDEAEIEVIGYATTVAEVEARLQTCDIVLLSANLPDQVGLKLTRTITKTAPSVKALPMGLPESEEAILQYIEAGAAGYVLKEDTVEELLRNIRAVYNNEAVISPQIAAAVIARVAELKDLYLESEVELDGTAALTPREREVLDLIGQGLTNQEIADQLTIELGTVKNHVHNILQKLNVSSRQAAAQLGQIKED